MIVFLVKIYDFTIIINIIFDFEFKVTQILYTNYNRLDNIIFNNDIHTYVKTKQNLSIANCTCKEQVVKKNRYSKLWL